MSRTPIEFSITDEAKGKGDSERIDACFASLFRLKADLQYLLIRLEKRIADLEES